MLNHLHIKANGCFVYMEVMLDLVNNGTIALRQVKDIPGTLSGLWLWLAQKLFKVRFFQNFKFRLFLNFVLQLRHFQFQKNFEDFLIA